MFLVLTGRSILLYHIWRISPHRLTFIEPRDYRVVFVLQQSERPENSGRCFHASYHHSNNSFSFLRDPASLIAIAATEYFVSIFCPLLLIPSGILFLRHNHLTKSFVNKGKKGGSRREKLSQNRPEMALHRSGYAKQVEIGVWHLFVNIK